MVPSSEPRRHPLRSTSRLNPPCRNRRRHPPNAPPAALPTRCCPRRSLPRVDVERRPAHPDPATSSHTDRWAGALPLSAHRSPTSLCPSRPPNDAAQHTRIRRPPIAWVDGPPSSHFSISLRPSRPLTEPTSSGRAEPTAAGRNCAMLD
ncbi:hypothetical protein GQ55_7G304900 [Panicum hallii var. hallii]|uniref:Uncharacterized protein n=1 Tax=Panicum hallii var. hallii TaxID=1504633 RepID=A0A2T7D0S5_9POAL|nr:hypothetical protein GQ55_7G304900 [Panicum hallii var. hallii]